MTVLDIMKQRPKPRSSMMVTRDGYTAAAKERPSHSLTPRPMSGRQYLSWRDTLAWQDASILLAQLSLRLSLLLLLLLLANGDRIIWTSDEPAFEVELLIYAD